MELFIVAVAVFLLAVVIGFAVCKCGRCCRPVAHEREPLDTLDKSAGNSEEIDERLFQAMCTPPMWFLAIAFSVTAVVAQDIKSAVDSSTEPAYAPIEKRVKPDRRHHHEEPTPQPDRQPGGGETIVVPAVPDAVSPADPSEGRHHGHDKKPRNADKDLQHDQKLKDRQHAKEERAKRWGIFWHHVVAGGVSFSPISWLLLPFNIVHAAWSWAWWAGSFAILFALAVTLIVVAVCFLATVLMGKAVGRLWCWLMRCFGRTNSEKKNGA